VAGSNPDSFFCLLPPLQTAAEFYLDCHVAALLAMTASAFFSGLSEHFVMKACPRHCDRERSVAGSNPDFLLLFAAFASSGGILSGLPRRCAPRNDGLGVFQQPAEAFCDESMPPSLRPRAKRGGKQSRLSSAFCRLCKQRRNFIWIATSLRSSQ